jgi:hypothetical protein
MDLTRITQRIRDAYRNAGTFWVRIEKIAELSGLGPDEMYAGVRALMASDDGFRAEPEAFGHRVTAWDRANAPEIGGEPRHKICWYS